MRSLNFKAPCIVCIFIDAFFDETSIASNDPKSILKISIHASDLTKTMLNNYSGLKNKSIMIAMGRHRSF